MQIASTSVLCSAVREITSDSGEESCWATLISTTDLDPETLGRSDDEIVGDAARVEVKGHPDGEGESGGAPAVRLSHEERPVGFAQENFQCKVPEKYIRP